MKTKCNIGMFHKVSIIIINLKTSLKYKEFFLFLNGIQIANILLKLTIYCFRIKRTKKNHKK